MRRAFAGIWVEEADLADAATVARLLDACGHPAAVLDEARKDETATLYARDTQAALAAGVFGAPTYLLDGEPFWGQDRLEMLDEALTSGRPPLRP